MDKNVVDFYDEFNKKQAEKDKDLTTRAVRLYVSIVLGKIELITNQSPYNIETVQKVCQCFDKANEEFLGNDEIMEKYGSDEDTPSIQLFLINSLIDRTIELFFGGSFRKDKL